MHSVICLNRICLNRYVEAKFVSDKLRNILSPEASVSLSPFLSWLNRNVDV
jgi:hypothetical protein